MSIMVLDWYVVNVERHRNKMKTVGNDIKVLLTKYKKHVKVDDIGGELILYDNSDSLIDPKGSEKFLLKDHMFSGIALSEYSDIVEFKLENFYEEEMRFTLHKNFIYVNKTEAMDRDDPIAIVRFIPIQAKFWAGDYFYAHFLETEM